MIFAYMRVYLRTGEDKKAKMEEPKRICKMKEEKVRGDFHFHLTSGLCILRVNTSYTHTDTHRYTPTTS